MKGKVHIGFKGAQKKVEGEGYSAASAGAIIAASSRNASSKAKKKNPRLNKVKGAAERFKKKVAGG